MAYGPLPSTGVFAMSAASATMTGTDSAPFLRTTTLLERQLAELHRGMPLVESPQLAAAVHWKPAADMPFHRWFRYREAFSPLLLEQFPGSKTRLDPFCGCGTTLLTSAHAGVAACGIDINPLATFITQTKSARYTPRDATRFLRISRDAIRALCTTDPHVTPDYPLLSKLFLAESLDTLLRLRAYIDAAADGAVHDLLLLAWISILERCSNTFKEGNGLKYRNKRRAPGRYLTVPDEQWIPRYFGEDIVHFVIAAWTNQCALMAEDIRAADFARYKAPEVRTGSCMTAENLDFGMPFDLVVFSPPYANRFDYFEAFKIELWMGGFVSSRDEMLALRSSGMRSNLAARRHRSDALWSPLAPFIEAMDPAASSVRMGIGPALEGYFYDTRRLLAGLRPYIAPNGQVAIVVGNSAYAKSIIATDALVARVAEEEGYTVREIRVARHLHVSSQQRSSLGHLEDYMRESVVVLELQQC